MDSVESQETQTMRSALESEELLLHSLSAFRGVLARLFEALRPRSICEVGIEGGLTARFLLDYCRDQDCRYTGIDPSIPDDVQRMILDAGQTFVQEPSLTALPALPLHDLYLIDGDHNYYTVSGELRIILEQARSGNRYPCILLHDVTWPCARNSFTSTITSWA
jgi:hypothetical protein